MRPSNFAIFGLQRSGTNYLDRLLLKNFECGSLNNDTAPLSKTLWKHSLQVPPHDTVGHVFIIHKNPYKWIESISKRKFFWIKSVSALTFNDYMAGIQEYPAEERSAGTILCGKQKLNLGNLVKTWNRFHRNYLEHLWKVPTTWIRYRDLLQNRTQFLESVPFNRRSDEWLNTGPGEVPQSNFNKESLNYYLDDRRFDYLSTHHLENINTMIDREILNRLGYNIHG